MFELKQLPDTLKYGYLDEKKIYPIIISANLLEHEEERLLKVLKKHRAAIGYTLDDLMGISPTLCQHKINMEPDAKPVVLCHLNTPPVNSRTYRVSAHPPVVHVLHKSLRNTTRYSENPQQPIALGSCLLSL